MSQSLLTNLTMGTGICVMKPGGGQGSLSYASTLTCPPCPQWPYCEKRCSYCHFNKYIPRGVEEAAMRNCLVIEAQTLLRFSGVRRWVLGGTVDRVLGIV
jgi:hypothetical protein